MLLTIEIPATSDSDNTYSPSNVKFVITEDSIYVQIDDRRMELDRASFVAFAKLLVVNE